MPEYHYQLSEEDDLTVSFETQQKYRQKAQLIKFCISYRTRVDGEWKEVVRFDNAHGDPPHRHIFNKYGEKRKAVLGAQGDESRIFNELCKIMKRDYQKYKLHFLHG